MNLQKGESIMKKNYQQPKMECLGVETRDILTASKLQASPTPGIGDTVIW